MTTGTMKSTSVLLICLTTCHASVIFETEPEWLWDDENNAGEFEINKNHTRAENVANELRSIACQKPIEGRVMYIVLIDPNGDVPIGVGFLPSTTIIGSGQQVLGQSHAGCLGEGYSYWSDGSFCHIDPAGICPSLSLPKYLPGEAIAMVIDTHKRTISVMMNSGKGPEQIVAENINPGAYVFAMVATKKGAVKIVSIERLG